MYQTHKTSYGLTIVTEHIPYVKSVSFGIFVGCGSRYEDKENNGISHFIEHMLFKGTKHRTAKQIVESFDHIGGQINAFTGKDVTCFYTKTLDTHIDVSIDVLSDMFLYPLFHETDIETEKKVIAEEINMYEDSPEDLACDLLMEAVWKGDSLSYPILGTKKSLAGLMTNDLFSYMKQYYCPSNMVIAVAGNFSQKDLIEKISNAFSPLEDFQMQKKLFLPVSYQKVSIKRKKDVEQSHICISFPGLYLEDERLYSMLVMNLLFGGGMSSRLFQSVRETLGLAYSIYSFSQSYRGAGLLSIYAACGKETAIQAINQIKEEISLLKRNKLSSKEVAVGKEQIKGNYILGLESVSSHMSSIGKSQLLYGRIRTPEEIIKKCDAITADTVADVIDTIFEEKLMSISVAGAIPDLLI